MIAETLVRRNLERFFDAFERKDFDTMAMSWSEDVVLEHQPGVPMAGAWRGLHEIRAYMEAVFAYNERIRMRLDRVTVGHPWSPSGTCTIVAEWEAEEEHDGHVLRTAVVSVAETRRWKAVRTRDYFFDVPAVAEHYADLELPQRTVPPPHAA